MTEQAQNLLATHKFSVAGKMRTFRMEIGDAELIEQATNMGMIEIASALYNGKLPVYRLAHIFYHTQPKVEDGPAELSYEACVAAIYGPEANKKYIHAATLVNQLFVDGKKKSATRRSARKSKTKPTSR